MKRDRQKYYTIPDLAEMFGVHSRTIRRLIDDGEIQAFRVGAQWRVSSEQLDNYIESTTNKKSGEK